MKYSKKAIMILATLANLSNRKISCTCSAFLLATNTPSAQKTLSSFMIQHSRKNYMVPFTLSSFGSSATRNSSYGTTTMHHRGTWRGGSIMNNRSSFQALKLFSTLTFDPSPLLPPHEIIMIGRKETFSSSLFLEQLLPKMICPTNTSISSSDTTEERETSTSTASYDAKIIVEAMIKSIGKSGKAISFLPSNHSSSSSSSVSKLTLIVLPDKVSRNNHPMSPHTITDSLQGVLDKSEKAQIHVLDCDVEKYMGAIAVAIARALPIYSAKTASSKSQKQGGEEDNHMINGGPKVSVSFYSEQGDVVEKEDLWKSVRAVADGVRLACKLGDMPPAELTPSKYAEECRKIAEELEGVDIEEIVGEELRERGYGGVYGVGMGAKDAPRILIMKYTPKDDDVGEGVEMENIVLCGKGVVYDTGGLSLKPKTGMCGMKHDMGGSAGVLGGFKAAVELKVPKKITLILGIVENAIGPNSVRNDDILTMYSGKSVEINNTDAEGRLVLADCVAHASKHIDGAQIILDMATLTGAQLVTTGKKHAGILAKSPELEKRIFDCGLMSGDLCYPMLYAPELLKSEFASKVADMKNSVKDRGNAQSSCAGHFIESHLDPSYQGDWVHVDMAGPGTKNERATGYGVGLVLSLLQAPGF